jgi:quinol monooxygenase YgiN
MLADNVKVVVKVTARSDTIEKIRAIVLELAMQSREEQGCLSYEVIQNLAEPEVFVLYEEWASAGHLDAHNKTPHFHAAVSQAQSLLGKPLEVGRFRTIL